MAISSVLSTGLQGIQTGIRKLDAAAGDAARLNGAMPGNQAGVNAAANPAQPTGPAAGQQPAPVDFTSTRVEQVEAGVLVQANANTIEVASENLGTLIDTMA